jgi:uncharacterized zinc-type alcohol dehydrogenase-like protein
VQLGDRVGFGWIKASCRSCLPCLRGNENLCHEGITGLIVGEGNFGGFQPHMRGPVSRGSRGAASCWSFWGYPPPTATPLGHTQLSHAAADTAAAPPPFSPLLNPLPKADFAYKIPDSISSTDAAPLLCAGITVYAPLRKFIKHPGMTVAVLGVGGLGHLGVQYAAAMGAVVRVLRGRAGMAEMLRPSRPRWHAAAARVPVPPSPASPCPPFCPCPR